MRANTKKNFTCFPSYAQIAEDSSVSLSRIKIVIRALEEEGWIVRQARGRRASNLFFINVPALKAAAYKRQAELRNGQLEETDDPCNVNRLCYDGGTNELDNTDGLESEPEEPEIPVWVGGCKEVPHLVTMLRHMWGDHPTF
jgi:DNA-binding transcriptional MocR family regulator